METDHLRACLREPFHVLVGIDDHQMDIHRHGHGLRDRLHDRESERDVRNKRAVHHVYVDQVGVLVDHSDVRLKVQKIAGKY